MTPEEALRHPDKPEWAKWLAIDECNTAWYYNERPRKGKRRWWLQNGLSKKSDPVKFFLPEDTTYAGDWKDALWELLDWGAVRQHFANGDTVTNLFIDRDFTVHRPAATKQKEPKMPLKKFDTIADLVISLVKDGACEKAVKWLMNWSGVHMQRSENQWKRVWDYAKKQDFGEDIIPWLDKYGYWFPDLEKQKREPKIGDVYTDGTCHWYIGQKDDDVEWIYLGRYRFGSSQGINGRPNPETELNYLGHISPSRLRNLIMDNLDE